MRATCYAFGMRQVTFETDSMAILDDLSTREPDVVLVSLDHYPDKLPYELIEYIRRNDKSPNEFAPIIAVSANANRSTVYRALNAGVHEFVALPLSVRTLWRSIHYSVFMGRPFVRTPEYFGPCRRRKDDETYTGPERRDQTATNARAAQEARMNEMLGNAADTIEI